MHAQLEGGCIIRASSSSFIPSSVTKSTFSPKHCYAKLPPRFACCLCRSPVCAFGTFPPSLPWNFFLGYTFLSYAPHSTLSPSPLPTSAPHSFPSSSHRRSPRLASGNYRAVCFWFNSFKCSSREMSPVCARATWPLSVGPGRWLRWSCTSLSVDVSEGWCGRRRGHGAMLTETQNRGGRCIYTFSENPREDLGEINENTKSIYLWEVTFFLFLPPHF